jgi:hypothetical protein
VESRTGAISEQAGTIAATSDLARREVLRVEAVTHALKRRVESMQSNSTRILVEGAQDDHRLFVATILDEAGKAGLGMAPDQVPDHHQCRFGKWYDAAGEDVLGALKEFRDLAPIHADVHALARQVLEATPAGRPDEANRLGVELVAREGEIIRGLQALCERLPG